MSKILKLTLLKSPAHQEKPIKDTLRILKLNKRYSIAYHRTVPTALGRINKIKHMIKIEEIDESILERF